MQMRTWMMAGAVALAAVTALLWVGGGDDEASDVAVSGAPSDQAASSVFPDLPSMTPDQVRGRLFEQGSLSGTEPAGDWCVQADQLQPCPELRRRFEHYIVALGDTAVKDIRKLTAEEARQVHGDKLAADIMVIWDKYWQVRTYTWRNKLEPGDLRTWMPAFEEQRQVRQQILGPEWAQAFFDEDDRQFKAYYERMNSNAPPTPSASTPRM